MHTITRDIHEAENVWVLKGPRQTHRQTELKVLNGRNRGLRLSSKKKKGEKKTRSAKLIICQVCCQSTAKSFTINTSASHHDWQAWHHPSSNSSVYTSHELPSTCKLRRRQNRSEHSFLKWLIDLHTQKKSCNKVVLQRDSFRCKTDPSPLVLSESKP
jgi:hypothetical protein